MLGLGSAVRVRAIVRVTVRVTVSVQVRVIYFILFGFKVRVARRLGSGSGLELRGMRARA